MINQSTHQKDIFKKREKINMSYCLEVSQCIANKSNIFIFSYGIKDDIEISVTEICGKKVIYKSSLSLEELNDLRDMCDVALNHQMYKAVELRK